MRPLLHVEHLVKQYPKSTQPAVADVSFRVDAGEWFALYGPSGAGKSTILAILATLLAKSRGRVTLADCDLDDQALAIRQEVGLVSPAVPLAPTLTAEENLRRHVCHYELYPYYPLYRQMPARYRQRMADLANELDCDLGQPVACLSRFMQCKLAIARSLLHDPLLLLLDEPTAGLDSQEQAAIWQYLHTSRRRKGLTLVLATADLAEANAADRVGLLQHGRLIPEARPPQMPALMKESSSCYAAELPYASSHAKPAGARRAAHSAVRCRWPHN